MLIIFDTRTGSTERFVKKLGFNHIKIEPDLIITEPYVLVTYTFGFGNIPRTTQSFLDNNYKYIIGVASNANRNWGKNYGKAADRISEKYNVPIIHKFELAGNQSDVDKFIEECKRLEIY